MSEPVLTLSSERFQPSGGFAAEGVKKLLGAPKLSLMQTVLRETVQNTWDARNERDPIKYLVRLRRLTKQQVEFLRANIYAKTPPHLGKHPILQFAESKTPIVMEIADWGTRGLGGPTRADVSALADQPSNFVDFIRNIGMRHHGPVGAGTYGYGKSSLYLASQCATIIVDTLAEKGRSAERRLISAHLGETYQHRSVKYTGRHWWGAPSGEAEYVEPLTGMQARTFSEKLGMPPRAGQETGTTIMVLAPNLSSNDPREILGSIQEAILWHFWPKMLDDNGPLRRINFELEVEGQRAAFPSPESFPPLDLFVEAYRALHSGKGNCSTVECQRPIKTLGKLSISKGFRSERTPYVSTANSVVPHTSAHIAVMRPVELVVRYFEGAALPNSAQEWAGVFICDEDESVERAFAAAEPPAHDDWVPEMLQKGHQKTFVNVALRRIKQAAASFAVPSGEFSNLDSDQPTLARAADRLGKLLEGQIADGSSAGGGGTGGGGGGRSKNPVTIGNPRFIRLIEANIGLEAEFEVRIKNQSGSELRVTAVPGAVIDGALSGEQTGPNGQPIRVRGWETTGGKSLGLGPNLTVPRRTDETYRIRITVPPMTATSVSVERAGGRS
jgi:hypothetical protein